MRIPDTPTGEFVAGDPTTAKPGSMLTSLLMNSWLRELKGIVLAGDLELDGDDDGQVLQAIRNIIGQATTGLPRIYSIANLPTTDVGPIVVAECSEVWIWSASAYFTGYRSPLCGRPLDGHTVTPLASEIDAVGGLLPKAAYGRLWGYAQENGLVVSAAVWTANPGAHYFVDVDLNQFRVPDLRNMFRRFTGTDADTANARVLGSLQPDALRKHDHGLKTQGGGGVGLIVFPDLGNGDNTPWAEVGPGAWNDQVKIGYRVATAETGGSETRPLNVVYHPRIHV